MVAMSGVLETLGRLKDFDMYQMRSCFDTLLTSERCGVFQWMVIKSNFKHEFLVLDRV